MGLPTHDLSDEQVAQARVDLCKAELLLDEAAELCKAAMRRLYGPHGEKPGDAGGRRQRD